MDYDGIRSSLIPTLSFLIDSRALAERLRHGSSHQGPRISPLAWRYAQPRAHSSLLVDDKQRGKGRAEPTSPDKRSLLLKWNVPPFLAPASHFPSGCWSRETTHHRWSIPCHSMLGHTVEQVDRVEHAVLFMVTSTDALILEKSHIPCFWCGGCRHNHSRMRRRGNQFRVEQTELHGHSQEKSRESFWLSLPLLPFRHTP